MVDMGQTEAGSGSQRKYLVEVTHALGLQGGVHDVRLIKALLDRENTQSHGNLKGSLGVSEGTMSIGWCWSAGPRD